MLHIKRSIASSVSAWGEFGVAIALAGVAATGLIGELRAGHATVDPVVITESNSVAGPGAVNARCRASLSTRSFELCGERVL
jgi:hypothetical protein